MAESSVKIVSNNVNLQLDNNSAERSEASEDNKTETGTLNSFRLTFNLDPYDISLLCDKYF